MQRAIELYNTPDGRVCIKPENDAMFILDENKCNIIQPMLGNIHNLYPDAFKKLSEIYSKSSRNKKYYEFRMVHRFCRCNFGSYDTLQKDIDANGEWHLEQVNCPLRGECPEEGIICMPKLHTVLSDREFEVAKLLGYMSPEEISDELHLSIRTVYNHIQSIKFRLKLKTIAQIATWYKTSNNL